MKKSKSPLKGLKQAHTSNSQIGMGDYYGSGIKNPIGKSREIMGMKVSGAKKTLKKPLTLA